jgi:predicted TIM-barrel fold metal-dependent hydrolase
MAKNFPNVFIDMCWLHIISPKVARESLAEWIETVPANKITGFGGDYLYVEGAYAHAEMAREVVAAVLAEKVRSGCLTAADARELAVKFLRNNAIDLYQLRPSKTRPPGRHL